MATPQFTGGGRIYDTAVIPGINADGSTDDATILQPYLVNTIAAKDGGVLLVSEKHAILTALDIPDTVVTVFVPGGRFDLGTTGSVKFNAPIEAEPIQIFKITGSGTVSFAAGVQAEVYPEWWGAKGDALFSKPGTDQGTDNVHSYTREWFSDTASPPTAATAATDNSTTFPMAVAAGVNRTVVLTGTYLVNVPLSLPSYTCLVSRNGGGIVTGVLVPDETPTGQVVKGMLCSENKHHLRIEGLRLEGLDVSLLAGGSEGEGLIHQERTISLSGCSNIQIIGCDISRTTKGISIENCTDWRVIDNYVHDIRTRTDDAEGYGVITTGPLGTNANWAISRNVFDTIERHAIYVSSGSSNGVVEGNVIRTCRSVGIHLNSSDTEPTIKNVTISGNSITDIPGGHIPSADIVNSTGPVSPWGIGGTGNMTGLTIVGNSISNTECGIVFQGAPLFAPTENPTGLTIVGNTISNPNSGAGLGIAVYNAQDVQIASNTVLNPSGTGILANVPEINPVPQGSHLSRITIVGNEVVGAGDHAINISGGKQVSDIVLGHNTLRNCNNRFWNIPPDTVGAITYDLPLLTFHFAKAKVAKSSKAIMDGPLADVSSYPTPSGKNCYIVGIAAASDATPTGTCTIRLLKDGNSAGTPTLDLPSGSQTASTSLLPGLFAWSPTERLSAQLETDKLAPADKFSVTVIVTVMMYDLDPVSPGS